MFPGQRTSRRNQELESMAMDATDSGDYDDYGLPSRPASGPAKPKSKLLGRFRKQASSSNLASQMDGDSDEEDTFMPRAARGQFQVQPPPGQAGQIQPQGHFQQYVPQPADAAAYAAHAQGAAGVQGPPDARADARASSPGLPSQGDISMDQISSIRDRHRYPGFEDETKSGGRAMSLNSMSAYDTTPIIPMLGPVTNFQSGSAHNRATPQEKYRSRMIESRRALLSSETAIPLSGTPQPGRPQGPSDPYLANLAGVPNMNGTPRSMSLSSSSGGGPGPGPSGPVPYGQTGSRSMTMMSGPPAPLRGPPPNGPGAPMQYNGPYGSPYNASSPGMGPGMLPPHPQRPPSNQNAAWNARGPGNYPQQPLHQSSASHGTLPGMGHQNMGHPNMGHPNMGYQNMGHQNPNMGQPNMAHQNMGHQNMGHQNMGHQNMGHPNMGHPNMGHPNMPPGRPGMGAGPQHAGAPPNQNANQGASASQKQAQPQYDTSADAFDFGPEYASPRDGAEATATADAAPSGTDSHKIEELNARLAEREDEIRMLSIELAESSRRELHLAPVHDADAQARSAALAKAHDELSLERARRAAVERAASNPDVGVHDELADMGHRHSEAVHLLAIRTEQYEMLQKKHASLSIDYERRLHEYEDAAARLKETEVRQRTQQQDELLGQQVRTLEAENAKLRQQIDEGAPQGRLSERVVDLEEQRKALQETLRTMRERKDSEINALRSRVEQLQQQVQQQQQQRGRISSAGSAAGSAPGSAGSVPEGAAHPFRPTPIRVMSRQSSTDSVSGDDNRTLSMPRMRDTTPARPASPLHLRINYEKREAV